MGPYVISLTSIVFCIIYLLDIFRQFWNSQFMCLLQSKLYGLDKPKRPFIFLKVGDICRGYSLPYIRFVYMRFDSFVHDVITLCYDPAPVMVTF